VFGLGAEREIVFSSFFFSMALYSVAGVWEVWASQRAQNAFFFFCCLQRDCRYPTGLFHFASSFGGEVLPSNCITRMLPPTLFVLKNR
jgi:hypothetical protein